MRSNAENVCEHTVSREMTRQLEEIGRAIGATTRDPHIALCRPGGAFRLTTVLLETGLPPDGETRSVQCLPVRAPEYSCLVVAWRRWCGALGGERQRRW